MSVISSLTSTIRHQVLPAIIPLSGGRLLVSLLYSRLFNGFTCRCVPHVFCGDVLTSFQWQCEQTASWFASVFLMRAWQVSRNSLPRQLSSTPSNWDGSVLEGVLNAGWKRMFSNDGCLTAAQKVGLTDRWQLQTEVGMQDECVVSSTDSCCTTADQKCFLLNFPQMMSPRLCIKEACLHLSDCSQCCWRHF